MNILVPLFTYPNKTAKKFEIMSKYLEQGQDYRLRHAISHYTSLKIIIYKIPYYVYINIDDYVKFEKITENLSTIKYQLNKYNDAKNIIKYYNITYAKNTGQWHIPPEFYYERDKIKLLASIIDYIEILHVYKMSILLDEYMIKDVAVHIVALFMTKLQSQDIKCDFYNQ